MADIKAILFDFNGTLFWDSTYHDRAWADFAQKYAFRNVSDEQMKHHVHGRSNPDILAYIFGNIPDNNSIKKYSQIKEEMYLRLITSDKGLSELAPGAKELLDYLKNNNYLLNIATSSEKENVEFFFKHLDLGQWFELKKVVFFDGSFNPKPAPDIFLKAAKNMGMHPENCLVVEDSIAGIQSARNAGIQKILYIENGTPIDSIRINHLIDGRINHFKLLKDYL